MFSKIRGAINAIAQITEERGNNFEVVTHSSGNAAQAIALAATINGIKSKVVMPRNAPETKRNATVDYGAEIHLCDNTAEVCCVFFTRQ